MYKTISSFTKNTFVAFAFAALSLTVLAQTAPPPAVPATSPKPGPGGGPAIPVTGLATPGNAVPTFPPMLVGIVTPEEYRTYIDFQQHINDDPAIKDLNAKISEVTKELQRLRMEAGAAKEKLVAANPEILAIRTKIMTVMHSRSGPGPMVKPAPVTPVKSN